MGPTRNPGQRSYSPVGRRKGVVRRPRVGIEPQILRRDALRAGRGPGALHSVTGVPVRSLGGRE